MQENSPVENLCIGTIYFITLFIVGFLTKRSFKVVEPKIRKENAKKKEKISHVNIHEVDKKEKYK